MRPQTNHYYHIMMTYIPDNSTVLDLGCGNGLPFRQTNFPLLIGIDIFRKKFNMPEYNILLYQDIRTIDKLTADKSFDVVSAIDVIEHLEKEEGYKLLKEMERIAKEMVMVFTPLVWSKNNEAVEDEKCWAYGNENNYHKSLWSERDFIKLGYEIVPCQDKYVLAIKKPSEVCENE